MWIVAAYPQSHSQYWLGLRVGGHLALSLHSSNSPCEQSQYLCHDDSGKKIITGIITTTLMINSEMEAG